MQGNKGDVTFKCSKQLHAHQLRWSDPLDTDFALFSWDCLYTKYLCNNTNGQLVDAGKEMNNQTFNFTLEKKQRIQNLEIYSVIELNGAACEYTVDTRWVGVQQSAGWSSAGLVGMYMGSMQSCQLHLCLKESLVGGGA
jgi:hypothetical protein